MSQVDESEADDMAADSGAEAAVQADNKAAFIEAQKGARGRSITPLKEAQETVQRRRGDEPSGVVHRRGGRVMSEEAKAAKAAMIADLGKQFAEGEAVDQMDDLDLAYEEKSRQDPRERLEKKPTAPAAPAAQAQAIDAAKTPQERSQAIADAVTAPAGQQPAAAAPAQPATPAVPAEPPAPSLDPAVLDRRRALDEREQALIVRERELDQREAGGDAQRIHDGYAEQPVTTMVDIIKKSMGIEKTEDLVREVTDLINGLSSEVLGVELPPGVLQQLSEKRTKAMVKNHEKRLSAREVEIERKRIEHERVAARGSMEAALNQHIKASDNAKTYPWLAREGSPGDIVLDTLETKLIRDAMAIDPSIAKITSKAERLEAAEQLRQQGKIKIMPWAEAAAACDAYLKQHIAQPYYEARKDLFQTGQPQPAAQPQTETAPKPPTTEVQQGDPAGIRGSRTLSNAVTSQPSGAPRGERQEPADDDGSRSRSRHWNGDRYRADTRRAYRQAFRQSGEDQT